MIHCCLCEQFEDDEELCDVVEVGRLSNPLGVIGIGTACKEISSEDESDNQEESSQLSHAGLNCSPWKNFGTKLGNGEAQMLQRISSEVEVEDSERGTVFSSCKPKMSEDKLRGVSADFSSSFIFSLVSSPSSFLQYLISVLCFFIFVFILSSFLQLFDFNVESCKHTILLIQFCV